MLVQKRAAASPRQQTDVQSHSQTDERLPPSAGREADPFCFEILGASTVLGAPTASLCAGRESLVVCVCFRDCLFDLRYIWDNIYRKLERGQQIFFPLAASRMKLEGSRFKCIGAHTVILNVRNTFIRLSDASRTAVIGSRFETVGAPTVRLSASNKLLFPLDASRIVINKM